MFKIKLYGENEPFATVELFLFGPGDLQPGATFEFEGKDYKVLHVHRPAIRIKYKEGKRVFDNTNDLQYENARLPMVTVTEIPKL
jgi:hypothetical protein